MSRSKVLVSVIAGPSAPNVAAVEGESFVKPAVPSPETFTLATAALSRIESPLRKTPPICSGIVRPVITSWAGV